MVVFDLGVNLFLGHANKLTLNYQNRPVYQANTIGELKSMIEKRKVVQYQLEIN
jgi:hypothetical protein